MSATSAICHAVFRKGANYSGTPPIRRSPVLTAFARQVLAANLAQLPDALIIPLGKEATQGVLLAEVDPRRVLTGLPHASGGNGHRKKQYDANREQLAEAVRAWF